MIRTLLTLQICVITYVASQVPQWNMHHSCDEIIGDSSLGGFMSLDSDLLTWNHQYECRVQVRPAVFNDPHRTPRILFHFSDVEIGPGSCEDANLTVIDGAFRPWDYHHDIVKGLKTPMCGKNSSFTSDLTFTSSNEKITLIFRRKSSGIKAKARFNMTFIAFYEGPCDDNEETYTCNQSPDEEFNKCINREFVCLGVNPCGDNSDCPDVDLEEVMEWWQGLLDSIKNFAIFFAIIVCICVIGKFMDTARRRGSGLEKLPFIGSFFGRLSDRTNTQERRDSHQMDSQPVTDDLFSEPPAYPPAAPPDNVSRTDSVSSQSSESSTDADILPTAPPPDYGALTPSAPSDDQHHVSLPPSYDEVIANADKYAKSK